MGLICFYVYFRAMLLPAKNTNNKFKKASMKKQILVAVVAIGAIAGAVALTGCNVTRTVTTQSQYIQKNDTNIVIQTKTIETYDASKKGL